MTFIVINELIGLCKKDGLYLPRIFQKTFAKSSKPFLLRLVEVRIRCREAHNQRDLFMPPQATYISRDSFWSEVELSCTFIQ